jgi:hypothetical protein
MHYTNPIKIINNYKYIKYIYYILVSCLWVVVRTTGCRLVFHPRGDGYIANLANAS